MSLSLDSLLPLIKEAGSQIIDIPAKQGLICYYGATGAAKSSLICYHLDY
jgi:hypothetical protein